MKNVEKNKKIVDEKILKCYYNICKYYNKDYNLILKFINIKLSKQLSTSKTKIRNILIIVIYIKNENKTENPRVTGSIPVRGTKKQLYLKGLGIAIFFEYKNYCKS